MGLLSFLKRRSADAPSAASDGADSIQQARTRARQRLIGAVVLVAAGVIGFPMLFETQPRPLSVNTPIEIARRDADATTTGVGAAAPPPAAAERPAARGAAAAERSADSAVITETAAESGREVATPAASAAARASDEKGASAASHPAVSAAASKPAATEKKPAAAEKKPTTADKKPEPEPAASDKSRAEALLSGHDAPTRNKATPSEADSGRYVVQVGAFGDTSAASGARQKVEKLGLKTYTQVVETSAGKRIRVRVGPFASRAEADKAASKVKASGLASAVISL